MPVAVSKQLGALVEPLADAVRHAQWQSNNGPLLLLGAGTIGLLCLAVAQAESAASHRDQR